jgi:2'-phosphotransferase
MTKISPDVGKVISGARSDCDVIVVINVKKAMNDGLKFFFSKNEVLLCPGNDDGMIPVEYFHRIYDRRTGEEVVVKDEETGEVLWPVVPLASA